MIDVVTTSFHIKAIDFERKAFEHYSTELFDKWDTYVEQKLDLADYSLTLVVEEGSIKGKGRIAASLAVVYFAIGGYGDFISGLQTIRNQVTYVADALFDQAKTTFGCTKEGGNSKRSDGAIAYLKNLFDRVQVGEITSKEAISDVKLHFGDEAIAVPGFLQDLESSLAGAPRHPKQLTLADATWVDCQEISFQKKKSPPKLPKPLPAPISLHYRIEISRDSKSQQKKVKITKVK